VKKGKQSLFTRYTNVDMRYMIAQVPWREWPSYVWTRLKREFVIVREGVRIYGIRYAYSITYREHMRKIRKRWKRRHFHNRRKKYAPALLERQNNLCNICKLPFDGKFRPTIDHIVPLSHDGEDSLDNLQALCEPCHRVKDSRVVRHNDPFTHVPFYVTPNFDEADQIEALKRQKFRCKMCNRSFSKVHRRAMWHTQEKRMLCVECVERMKVIHSNRRKWVAAKK